MEIKFVSDNFKDQVYRFLENVKGLEIEEKIVDNASLIIDNNEIQGMMSFEKYDYIGLIRYFIFKRTIDANQTLELLEHLKERAKEKEINTLIGIINNQEVEEVFSLLGFNLVPQENVYFDETIFENTEYKNSKVFAKKII